MRKVSKMHKIIKMQVDNSVKNLANIADLDADLERLVNKHPEFFKIIKNKSFGGIALLHTARIVKRRRANGDGSSKYDDKVER